MLGKGFNQNEYKTGNSFKIYQLCIYCETCDLKILESSNLDLRNGFYQNIQKRVRLPYLESPIQGWNATPRNLFIGCDQNLMFNLMNVLLARIGV